MLRPRAPRRLCAGHRAPALTPPPARHLDPPPPASASIPFRALHNLHVASSCGCLACLGTFMLSSVCIPPTLSRSHITYTTPSTSLLCCPLPLLMPPPPWLPFPAWEVGRSNAALALRQRLRAMRLLAARAAPLRASLRAAEEKPR